MTAVIVRLGLIVAAYLLASVVTGLVVTTSLTWHPDGMGDDARQGFFGFTVLVSFFVAYFAAAPAAAVVALGEFKSWRMWWYYALAGSLIGLALGYNFQPPAFFPWLGLGFGPISGLIYWAISGRNAGLEDGQQRKVTAGIVLAVFALSLLFSIPSMFGMMR